MEDFWNENRDSFVAKVMSMAVRAGSDLGENSKPSFKALSSSIPAINSDKHTSAVVIIDIGGTATKVGIRLVDSSTQSDPSWQVLMEDPNDSFDDKNLSGNSLERFSEMVAIRTATELKKLNLHDRDNWGLGIVWSNATTNPASRDFGIDGVVTARDRYSKGEWFCRDVKDGDSIGRVFKRAFTKKGISIGLTLVANDTPLTMKALPGANAGMVVSTGFNTTLVKEVDRGEIICNGETGTSFTIDSELVMAGDLIGIDTPATIIEHLVSGKNLPKLFASYIMKDRNTVSEFGELGNKLIEMGPEAFEFFSAPDLCNCLGNPDKFKQKCSLVAKLSDKDLPPYQALTKRLLLRSARLSAVIALASVYEQLSRRDKLVIALDSSLSRHIPYFWSAFQDSLKDITPAGKLITLNLVDRVEVEGGVLSVPMVGAANAIDALSTRFSS